MADNSKDRAGPQFDKQQKADIGRKNLSEYEATGAALRARTERLRALRLAREAAETAAAPAARPSATPKAKGVKVAKTAKGAKSASATLAEWLKAERSSGRNG